jgi:hypothetical protein
MTDLDIDEAVRLYTELQLSAKSLAARCGVPSPTACHLALHGRREGVHEVLTAAAALGQRDGSAPDSARAEGG